MERPRINFNEPLDILRSLRDDHIDMIPGEVVTLTDPNYHDYKCRKNWFNGVVLSLRLAEEAGYIPEHLKENMENLIKYYTSEEFQSKQLVTRSDIEKANSLLGKIVG